MKSRYTPIIVILLACSLIWLKEIHSNFLAACLQLLDALRSPTSAFGKCMTSAHELLWTIRAGEILVLILVICVVVDKRWPWWIKAGTCVAWAATILYLFSAD